MKAPRNGNKTRCKTDTQRSQSLTRKLLRDHKQLMPLGAFRMERLVDGEMLVLQGENLMALDIREGC